MPDSGADHHRQGHHSGLQRSAQFTGRDTDQIDLFLRRSYDGGGSFGEIQVVATEEGWVSGNPAPVQDRETGTIWLLFCRNRMDGDEPEISAGIAPRTVWVTFSDDDGATWSAPREITREVKLPQWSWYATGPGHGIQLRSGRLVVACDHRVMEFRDGTRDPDYSHVVYSDDHGASWHIGGSSDRGTNESTAWRPRTAGSTSTAATSRRATTATPASTG